ncbi:hypothetical protein MNBD_ALPHA12-1411 [hydrothermal vent metagenome]|uniref:Pilus formation protein N-terminal domain-containing protein n=1 Tax=hydrothermal vent metagenome TaxID=652676 RepID=A0A3B0U0R5_9ZZZZ
MRQGLLSFGINWPVRQLVCQIFTILVENAQQVISLLRAGFKVMKSPKSRLLIFALGAILAFMATLEPSIGAQNATVSVQVNMARLLRISSPAETIIIGNPGIADVTIQDAKTLILTGRSYGTTNLIVLDGAGNPIVDTMIEVVQKQGGIVTVFQGSARTTLACAPECQPMIMLGDNTDYTNDVIRSSGLIAGAAN